MISRDPSLSNNRPLQNLLAALHAHGCKPHRSGAGWKAICPAHKDHRPSLSIAAGDDGRALVRCFAGCSTESVVAALGLQMSDLMPDGSGRWKRNLNISRESEGFASASSNGQVFQTVEQAIAALAKQFGRPPDARWDYRDAAGAMVGTMLRWNTPAGKEIRPLARFPDGWHVAAMPAPRPLYRLPELLTAPLDQPVVVVEGEKAADAAVRCGLLATTSSGGAQAAAKTDWSQLRGRRVVILPDADEAGEKYAEHVVRLALGAGAAKVWVLRLVEHAHDLPPGGDLADVLESPTWCGLPLGDSSGPLDLGRWILDTAKTIEPWTPEPAAESTPAWQPFPVNALPTPVREFVSAAAESIGCDPSMVALPLLAVLARCIGNRRVIQLKPDWQEPAVIWTAVIAASGTHKTPAFNAAVRVLEDKQHATHLAYVDAVKQHEADEADYERAIVAWRRSKTGGPAPERPKPPTCEKYVVTDITIEALAARLAEQTDGVLIARDELAAWVDSFAEYKGGRGSDVGHWLACWGARSLGVERKQGVKSIYIPRAAVSITGGVQPAVFRRALAGEHQRDGLCARLLVAMPPDRDITWSEAQIGQQRWLDLRRLTDGLLTLPGDIGERGLEPRPMVPSTEAKRLFITFYNEHRRMMRRLDDDLRSAAAKLEAYAARLALVFACVRAAWTGTDSGTVDTESVEAGITLSRWFLHEAERVYGLFYESRQERDTRELAEWIERQGGSVTVRDVYSHGPRQFRGKVDDAEKALSDLVRAGLGAWDDTLISKRGGRPTRAFRLANYWKRKRNLNISRESEGFASTGVASNDSDGGSGGTVPPNPNPTPPVGGAEQGAMPDTEEEWRF